MGRQNFIADSSRKRKVSRDDSAGGRIDYSKWKHGVCTG